MGRGEVIREAEGGGRAGEWGKVRGQVTARVREQVREDRLAGQISVRLSRSLSLSPVLLLR